MLPPTLLQPPQPYSFGYDNVDEYGTNLFHKETGDANNVKRGSYGYTDANGLYRRVNYVADANGFRATVETNEPGTQAGASADAVFNANPVVVGPTGAGTVGTTYASPAYGSKASPGYGHHGYGHGGYGQAGYSRPGYEHHGRAHHGYGARS